MGEKVIQLLNLLKEFVRFGSENLTNYDNKVILENYLINLLYISCELEKKEIYDNSKTVTLPRFNYQTVKANVESNFPDLGYYNLCTKVTFDHNESDTMLGLATHDICELILEFNEILWRYKNISKENALWYFLVPTKDHWKNHVVNLLYYLHNLKIEGSNR